MNNGKSTGDSKMTQVKISSIWTKVYSKNSSAKMHFWLDEPIPKCRMGKGKVRDLPGYNTPFMINAR